MKKIVIALAIGTLALSTTANAALDETKEQIEKRYGKPIKEEKVMPPATYVATYQLGEIKIRVAYMNGRASYIKYYNIEENDIESIIKANQNSMHPWEKFTGKKGVPKPRIGTGSCYQSKTNAEARVARGGKRRSIVEFATDAWLKAKASVL